MITIGITGGIGSGKSVVSQLFSLCGIPVYIADVESKRLVASSPIIREQLIALFGEELFSGGVLDRALLAAHIFNDKEKLAAVNAIIHPEIRKDFFQWQSRHSHCPIVAQEAAILFESGFDRFMDKVITVYAPLEMRVERAMLRDQAEKQRIMERIANQMPDEEKVKRSDFVIINDDSRSLIEQVNDILLKLNAPPQT